MFYKNYIKSIFGITFLTFRFSGWKKDKIKIIIIAKGLNFIFNNYIWRVLLLKIFKKLVKYGFASYVFFFF